MDNIVLNNLFKVKRAGNTKTKLFKDLKENDVINLSIELDKRKDQGEHQRLTLCLNGQPTYISSLHNAIKCGLVLQEIYTKSARLMNKIKELESGVQIIKVNEDNLDIEKEIMSLKGKIEASKIPLEVMKERLKILKMELAKEGLVDYAGEVQDIINICNVKKYGDNKNE